jgi:hypothetical protein
VPDLEGTRRDQASGSLRPYKRREPVVLGERGHHLSGTGRVFVDQDRRSSVVRLLPPTLP